jgi:hypothetical protein
MRSGQIRPSLRLGSHSDSDEEGGRGRCGQARMWEVENNVLVTPESRPGHVVGVTSNSLARTWERGVGRQASSTSDERLAAARRRRRRRAESTTPPKAAGPYAEAAPIWPPDQPRPAREPAEGPAPCCWQAAATRMQHP